MVTHFRNAALVAAFIGAFAVHSAEHEHGVRRGVQCLDVCTDGAHVHLLTGESREGSKDPVLMHARSDDGGATWSSPVRVGEGMPPGFSLNRGMDAQVAAVGQHVIAAWTTAGTDKWGSGPIAIAVSENGGRTWRAGSNPADDGSTTGHGFIDIAADQSGAFHITWLDSRDGKQGLRYARSTDRGKTWSPNSTLKSATCECCSNALAAGPDSRLAILFRDGSPRDMAVTLSDNGGSRWSAPVTAGDFAWQFNGCPHVGGGIAFGRGGLHAAVWTGSESRGVYYLRSADFGSIWSKPVKLGGGAASHPDIAATTDGQVAAVWDEHAEGQSSIWGAWSSDAGQSWAQAVQLSKAGASATHPRVVATREGFRAFWTEDQADRGTVWVSAKLASMR